MQFWGLDFKGVVDPSLAAPIQPKKLLIFDCTKLETIEVVGVKLSVPEEIAFGVI